MVLMKKNWIILICTLIVFMIIGSLFDYQISLAVFNPDSLIGIFLASYGQLPAMLCFAIGGTLLLRLRQKGKTIKNALCYVFSILLNIFSIMGITMDPMLYIKNMPLILSLLIAVILVTISNIMIWNLTKETDRKHIRSFVTLILSVVFIEIIVINIIKVPWARPRMRMLALQPEAMFQPWWVIGNTAKESLMSLGVGAEEFKSFPSGHTGNAACALLLVTLPYISSCFKGKENLLWIIGVLLTVIVAFSRIVMGAHFLTDVTVGFIITVIIEYIGINLLLKKTSS